MLNLFKNGGWGKAGLQVIGVASLGLMFSNPAFAFPANAVAGIPSGAGIGAGFLTAAGVSCGSCHGALPSTATGSAFRVKVIATATPASGAPVIPDPTGAATTTTAATPVIVQQGQQLNVVIVPSGTTSTKFGFNTALFNALGAIAPIPTAALVAGSNATMAAITPAAPIGLFTHLVPTISTNPSFSYNVTTTSIMPGDYTLRTVVVAANGDNTQAGDEWFSSTYASPSTTINIRVVPPGGTLVAPGAPTRGIATPLNNSVNIAFTPPTMGFANGAAVTGTGGSPITGYIASCVDATPTTFTAPGAATATSVTVTGLANGTAYTCSVQATNAIAPAGGASSTTVSVTPAAAAVVPPAPTIGATPAVLVNQQASVAFTAPTNNGGAAISRYTATCTDGITPKSATGITSPIVVLGLTIGNSYTCTVTATNSAGTSEASAATAAFVPSAPAATAGNTTAVGSNIAPAGLVNPTVTFATVGTPGVTTSTAVSTTDATNLPTFAAGVGSLPTGATLKAGFDVSTTATFTGNVDVCATLGPTSAAFNAAEFEGYRIYHAEGIPAAWVDRTYSRNAATNQICARVTSLSPFVIAALPIANSPASADVGNGGGGGCATRTDGLPDPILPLLALLAGLWLLRRRAR